MKLLVGLGNPGAKYAQNRHNIGFMAMDQIASDHGFGPWRSKFQGVISEGRFGSGKVILLKPETFMNLSGQSVGEAARFHKINSTDICVFHDEIDLAPGRLKTKAGGGHAGRRAADAVPAAFARLLPSARGRACAARVDPLVAARGAPWHDPRRLRLVAEPVRQRLR